jgi:sterol desaturase/sphingolipid hydroxylase (fatty acid hydroxylase superfamily)
MKNLVKNIFEFAFCPFVIFGSLAATWYARKQDIDWMQTLFFSSFAPILFITVFEWVAPYRKDWNYPFAKDRRGALKELGKDLLYMGFITRIHSWSLPWILPRLAPFAKIVGKKLAVYGLVSAWHPWVRVTVILLVSELFWYWGHRLQHTLPVLWRFHSTHHVPSRLTALKASRNHPVDLLFLTVLAFLPLAALGAKPTDMMWTALLQSLVNVTSHANVRMRSGIVSWFFATPDCHRVHHSAVIEESKANFGCRLLIWDRIFGTFRNRAARGDEIVVGVDPVGERSLKAELLEPFYKSIKGV